MNLYFDNAAAVPVRPVTMARLAALTQDFSANQEASGAAAEAVRAALSTAEHRLLNAVCGSKAQGRSVLWTSTGTDAVRAAVMAFLLTPEKHGEVLFTDGEHASIPPSLDMLPAACPRNRVKLQRDGRIDLTDLSMKLSERTRLIVFHWVQSETGVMQDLAAVRAMVKSIAPQASLLIDGIQGAGKLPFDFEVVQPEFFLVSGQKFGLPSGAAVLYSDEFRPAMKKLRTERHAIGRVPPPFCLLLAETLGGRMATMNGDLDYIRELRERFLSELKEALPDGCWRETVPAETASPYIVHLLFSGGPQTYQGAILTRIMAKFGASIASGSACEAETGTPSRVLTAMGLSRDEAYSAVRVSFFDQNTPDEAAELARLLARAVREY